MLTDIPSAFLGVESSFTGRRWIARPYDERAALALSQRFSLPEAIARSLSARGADLENAAEFLEPRLRDSLPDPSRFLDMGKAAERTAAAIMKGERLAIFGDYDVDGGTSSALLSRFIRRVSGNDPIIYIPDRMREGYGPNVDAMRTLAAAGASLVICVDCGTTAREALSAAQAAKLDVIVLDHHAAEPDLPPAYAIINPNRLDETMSEEYGALAAVGVAFLFVVALNRALREAGWYSSASAAKPEPDLLEWLDLVALGTVCDVVKLRGLNRAFVAQGLKVMDGRRNLGIAALAQLAGVKGRMDAYAAGFMLGPRINAGGRVGRSDLGARLLATDDPQTAMLLAEELHRLNDERRAIEAEVLKEAEGLTFDDHASPLTFVARDNWHAGVIGIVASRLKDKYHRPAIVIAIEGGIGKGSGRSIGEVDLGAAVIAARQAGLLLGGGGHRMAAGLTVEADKIPALREFLSERIGASLDSGERAFALPTLNLDGVVAGAAMNAEMLNRLDALAPFGAGNPEPRYALADCRVSYAEVVKDKHVRLVASHGKAKVRAMAFRAMESELGAELLSLSGRPCHLAGYLRRDDWRGAGHVQFLVSDGAEAN